MIYEFILCTFFYIISIAEEICLLKTVLTWGYAKASFRRFCFVYKNKLFSQPQAQIGSQALDAKVVNLSGEIQYLLRDFISTVPLGVPLILNMGSYT